jgi:hypothetical protein
LKPKFRLPIEYFANVNGNTMNLEYSFEIKYWKAIKNIRFKVHKFVAMNQKNENKLIEGEDFYYSPEGYKCFTENYHLKRGYCCKSGCRHCPYGFDKKTGEIKK